jgi:Putative transposase
VKVLSRLFRAKFASLLKHAFHQAKLGFHGKLQPLAKTRNFFRWLNDSLRSEWVVYAKPPFGGPQQVLKYLARYTHRVAISNRRLVALDNGCVTFRWKDYAQRPGQNPSLRLSRQSLPPPEHLVMPQVVGRSTAHQIARPQSRRRFACGRTESPADCSLSGM